MGYWENTSYIQSADAQRVANELIEILGCESMLHIPRPPERVPAQYDSMQYKGGIANDTWAIVVFPGSPGWTVIKTAPLELLAERAPSQDRMRLANLCASLGCMGFQLNVYDSSAAILVEVDQAGDVALSGFPYDFDGEPEEVKFHDEPMNIEERFELRFEKLPLETSEDYEEWPRQLARKLGGANACYCDNDTSVVTLLRHQPLQAQGGIELYFRRRGMDRSGS